MCSKVEGHNGTCEVLFIYLTYMKRHNVTSTAFNSRKLRNLALCRELLIFYN